MHQPVGQIYLIQKVGSTVNAHGVSSLLYSPHDISYHPLIAVKGKGSLQHDGDSVYNVSPKRMVYVQCHKISIDWFQDSSAFAFFSGTARQLYVTTFLASGHMKYHASTQTGKGFYSAQDMHQDTLAAAASAQDSH
jgi:hypothetical protein